MFESLEDVQLSKQYSLPRLPEQSTKSCALTAIRFKLFNPGPHSTEKKSYRATVEFKFDDETKYYVLYKNPVFVEAPPCRNGSHTIHCQDNEKFENVLDVFNLDKTPTIREGLMTINATSFTADAVARAWCSEMGKHAVVSNNQKTCIACAMEMAGDRGLRVGLVIWR